MKTLNVTSKFRMNISLALIAVLGLAIGSGCNNTNKSSSVSPADRNRLPTVNTTAFPVSGGWTANGQGRVYLNSTDLATRFAKYLASAYIDPANIGTVESQNITFSGYVAMDTAGRVDVNASGFEFQIRDSYAIQGKDENGNTLQVLRLGAPAVSMNLVANTATVVFRTANAEYTFTGNFDQTNYSGTFRFANATNYSSAEAPHSGSDIPFQIATCQFFRCQ